jgi:hypothetical protein
MMKIDSSNTFANSSHQDNGKNEPALIAHACNPSYWGVRDQEDQGSKPAQANSLRDPISKKSITDWFNCRAPA